MTTPDNTSPNEQPFMTHLFELRDRLLRMVLAVLAIFLLLFPFGNDIYIFIADPLMEVMPEGTSMIATQVASPFLTPFKLALVAAVFLAMPYLLFQFWGFIAPGLYKHEKRLAFPMLASSIFLFYLGAAFAYVVVFPLVFAFLTGVAPEGVAVMTDITHYLDFVLTLFFAFGLSFEVPIATILLVMMGMTTPEKLAEKRPYIIVGAFIIGMVLTPPDVISQTLLALPMWILFEIGIVLSRIFIRRKQEREDSAEEPADPEDDDPSDGNRPPSPPRSPLAGGDGSMEDLARGANFSDSPDYTPLTEEEMEAELDQLDYEDGDDVDYDEEFDEPELPAAASMDDKGADTPPAAAPVADEYEVEEAQLSDEVPPDDELAGESSALLNKDEEVSAETRAQRAAVVAKLEKVGQLRDEMKMSEARQLLYEVLVEGNDIQVKVARNILEQLDS